MAESTACLVRSFTTPAETSYESNPVRALGESISFGRFMTENLDWEKWSTFTHNRYVEEAEKYSKPGSVAAKKAYFEAHYKRKAAERAAALMQEANAQANGSLESEVQEGNCAESSFETSSKEDSVVATNEQPDKETVNCQVVECADRDQHKCDAGQSDVDISNVEGTEGVPHSRIDVGSCTLVDTCYPNQFHLVEDSKNVAVPEEESLLDHVNGSAGQEVSASLVEEREENSSPTLSTKAVAAKHSPSRDGRKVVPPRSGINSPKGKKSVGDLVEKKRLTAQSLQMSVNIPSGTGETSKTATADTIPKSPINLGAKIIKSVGDSVKKRPTTRSLHMSISLPSGAGETSKTAPVLEQNRIRKIHSSLPKNNTSALRTSVKASHGLLNEASANAPSGKPLKKFISGGVTANAKPSSSISSGCLKLSSTTKSNPQAATVSLPFRFRSEERAIKRKEFLQRINENKSNEEENMKLQRTLKGKTDHDHKKLRQSSGSLSKQKLGGSQSLSNQIRKISPTLPRSSNVGWKANSSTVQDKSSRNSWKPPISTNNSKRTTEKINRTTRQSVTSLSNTTRENASPNIQL